MRPTDLAIIGPDGTDAAANGVPAPASQKKKRKRRKVGAGDVNVPPSIPIPDWLQAPPDLSPEYAEYLGRLVGAYVKVKTYVGLMRTHSAWFSSAADRMAVATTILEHAEIVNLPPEAPAEPGDGDGDDVDEVCSSASFCKLNLFFF